jgi:hypothetical protein
MSLSERESVCQGHIFVGTSLARRVVLVLDRGEALPDGEMMQ